MVSSSTSKEDRSNPAIDRVAGEKPSREREKSAYTLGEKYSFFSSKQEVSYIPSTSSSSSSSVFFFPQIAGSRMVLVEREEEGTKGREAVWLTAEEMTRILVTAFGWSLSPFEQIWGKSNPPPYLFLFYEILLDR